MSTTPKLGFIASFLLLFLAASALRAQVPQLVNYQGRVAVHGVNFDGQGQFKFALVDGDGGRTFWSNDGTSREGDEPRHAVRLAVTNGLYSVLLGDAANLENMTAIPPAVFQNADVRLRVWFDDGDNGSQQLSPDQRIAAVGYAMMADTVTDGAITAAKIASGAVGSAQLAAGSVTATRLAPGAAATNLATSGQAGVPSGGLILSATDNPALVAAGYVKIGPTTAADTWKGLSVSTAPVPRIDHTAVWTGSEMIVWGGWNGGAGYFNDGGRYNPTTDVWTPLPSEYAPSVRKGHSAVWTGSEMIVWGGRYGSAINTGARYKPSTDQWSVMSMIGAPSARAFHAAVWTGSEMIVWSAGTGGRYNPVTDTWGAPISTVGAPPVINSSLAVTTVDVSVVWTGREMLVWQGRCQDMTGNIFGPCGGRYDPRDDTWRAMSLTNAPSCWSNGRCETVWTGSEMLVWSSMTASASAVWGGRYDPATDVWTPIGDMGGPADVLVGSSRVWTGSEMIVWGGATTVGSNVGYRYNPASRAWSTTRSDGAPLGRNKHSAVWTGTQMMIFGGYGSTVYFNDIWRFTPGKTLNLYQMPP